nr:PDR/VanB family oxidoreductase [Mycolicibacterium sp. P9-64]
MLDYDSTTVPPDIYGRFNRAPTIVVAAKLMAPAIKIMGRVLRQLPPPGEVDRSLLLTVTDRKVETSDGDVVSLRLADPPGAPLPAWTPGANVNVHLPSGRIRQYSLSGDPADGTYRIAVRRIQDGGGGSVELHDSIRVGDQLVVTGPVNAFPLALPTDGAGEDRMHFVAGGIGITPILPMVRAAEAARVPWTMVYAGRSRQSMPFLDELSRYGDRVTVHTDEEHGLPSISDLLPHDDAAIYCCGPTSMLDVVRSAVARQHGVPLHFERFAAPPIVDGVPFDVQLGTGGDVLHVAADKTALETIRAARPAVAYSCQQGFCGTCKVRVLKGEPVAYADRTSKRERSEMLICVDRADGGTLVLDL